jgi:hypothetical protein
MDADIAARTINADVIHIRDNVLPIFSLEKTIRGIIRNTRTTPMLVSIFRKPIVALSEKYLTGIKAKPNNIYVKNVRFNKDATQSVNRNKIPNGIT